ncbi:hypothetical protein ACLOJK_001120 [Asimina triloba]
MRVKSAPSIIGHIDPGAKSGYYWEQMDSIWSPSPVGFMVGPIFLDCTCAHDVSIRLAGKAAVSADDRTTNQRSFPPSQPASEISQDNPKDG